MIYGLNIEVINLNSAERMEVENFLSMFHLFLDKNVEYTLVAKIDGDIIGTCSIEGKVLKCFAVRAEMQGQGIAAFLITHAVNLLFEKGIYETFVFTMPENKGIFEDMGYREVYSIEKASLLEGGKANINKNIKKMFIDSGLNLGEKAALVMNCNPFTLGHRYLIEKASKENEQVVIFLVQENRSTFSFKVRFDLVKNGVKDLENVTVIPGGDYIISAATFPTYFLKQEDERLKTYTALDAGIFGRYIAPVFNIKRRYVGSEPNCTLTSAYNASLAEIMPRYGIELVITERLKKDCEVVSASRVRSLIKGGQMEEVKKLVPSVTYDFLTQTQTRG